MYILYQLPKEHNALSGAVGRYVFGLCDGESNFLLLLGNLVDHSTIEHDHLS
jgi:hypothetical protein